MKAALLLALASCQWVFPLDDNAAGDAGVDSCAAQQFEPLRYFSDTNLGKGMSWAEARDRCKTRLMDLVVLDTQEEFASARIEGQAPYWVGVMGNNDFTLDGCPAVNDFNEQVTASECIYVDVDFLMYGTICADDHRFDGQPFNALCETPQPAASCQPSQKIYSLGSSAGVTHDEGAAMCAPGRLVEINSPDELAEVEAAAAGLGVTSFWLGPQWGGMDWSVPSGCPAVFRWSGAEPLVEANNPRCAVHTVNVGATTELCGFQQPVICER